MKGSLPLVLTALVLLALPSTAFGLPTAHAQSPQVSAAPLAPVAVSLTATPKELPPGGSGEIIVQLVDAKGNPSPARNRSVTVDLYSSDPSVVGVLTQSVTIPLAKSHSEAQIRAGVQGNATITALATGFLSGSVTVSSSEFGDFTLDLELLSDPVAPGDVLGLQIELLAAGRPFETPAGVGVSITTSVSGIPPQTVQIQAGGCCGYASIMIPAGVNLTTTPSAIVTAAAQGFTSVEASVQLSARGDDPQYLLVNPYPETLMAGSRQTLSVALQNGTGAPAAGSFSVDLFTSNSSVVSLPIPEVQITNSDSVVFPVYANASGSVQITAVSPGLTPIPLTLTVTKPALPALSISLPAKVRVGESYSFSVGFVYEDRPIPSGPTTAYLSSSNQGLALPPSLDITASGYGIGVLSASSGGPANVTAALQGVRATAANLTSLFVPIVAPARYDVRVTSDLGPLEGVPVNFTYAGRSSIVETDSSGVAGFAAYNDTETLVAVPMLLAPTNATTFFFTGWSDGAKSPNVSLLSSVPTYTTTAEYFKSVVPTTYSLLALSDGQEPITGLRFNVSSGVLGRNLTLTTDSGGAASFVLPNATSFTVSLPTVLQPSEQAKYVFLSVDDSTKSTINVTSPSSVTITALYTTYYQFQVSSPIGTTTGSGWYRSGSPAPYSVSETSDGGPLVYQRFTGWTGSFSSAQPVGSTLVSSPEAIEASWTTDNTLLFVAVGASIAAAAFVGLLVFRLSRRAPQ